MEIQIIKSNKFIQRSLISVLDVKIAIIEFSNVGTITLDDRDPVFVSDLRTYNIDKLNNL